MISQVDSFKNELCFYIFSNISESLKVALGGCYEAAGALEVGEEE